MRETQGETEKPETKKRGSDGDTESDKETSDRKERE